MKSRLLSMIVCIIAVSLSHQFVSYSQAFNIKQVSDRVFILSGPDLGDQVVIKSEKGYVVFNSFWSEKTAEIFKEEIIKALGLNDFTYVINMVDRLDMIGGNAAYPRAVIVGHENIRNKYSRGSTVKEELADLINMWREKEEYSRSRLQKLKAGSEEALTEENWMKKCNSMADELESSFSLVLPEISFNDRMTLDPGDMEIKLFWLGNAGDYQGLTMAVIPHEKLAIISKAIVYPEYHLAPFPFPYYKNLDVSRWIMMLEEILEGESPPDSVILCDSYEVYPRERIMEHLKYIQELWNSVNSLKADGKTLEEIQDQLSLDKEFAFVKEMEVYKSMGDFWIRPQHEMHVKLFFLQGRTLASEIIRSGGPESILTSLSKIKNSGNDVYFDEISIDRIGYEWIKKGNISEAIEVYKLNTEAFPGSFNVFNNLGDAYLENGDKINAKKNYQKSLGLNPQNDNAREKLKQL